MSSPVPDFRSGYACIIGRPNVGKSTLLNSILGQKVAIVTSKPQTTRNRLTGIKTLPDCQIIFFDTPGIHRPLHRLGEIMVRSAVEAAREVDVLVWVVPPRKPAGEDLDILEEVRRISKPAVVAINKIDLVRKDDLLPLIGEFSRLAAFSGIVPVSAKTGDGVDSLVGVIRGLLPPGPMLYPGDMTTDQAERFIVGEIVREKLMEFTRDEIPHSAAVEVVRWQEDGERGLVSIDVNIVVERDSQKGIIIGGRGAMIKRIGSAARREIERFLGTRVYLSLWVKVSKDWRQNDRFLREMGFS